MKASKMIGPQTSTAVLEVRYAEAFAIWDRAGQMWQQISRKYPDMKLESAEPRTVKFQLEDFELIVEMARAVVVSNADQSDLKRFAEISATVTDSIRQNLGIASYSRVGLRLTYWNEFNSIEEAAEAWNGLGIAAVSGTRPLGKDSKFVRPEFSAHWETETNGLMIAIRTQTRKYNFKLPPQIRNQVDISKVSQESSGILIDADYYTRGVVGADLFNAPLWIDQSQAAIRRGLKGALGIAE